LFGQGFVRHSTAFKLPPGLDFASELVDSDMDSVYITNFETHQLHCKSLPIAIFTPILEEHCVEVDEEGIFEKTHG